MRSQWPTRPRVLYWLSLAGSIVFASLIFANGICRFVAREGEDGRLGPSLLRSPHLARWVLNFSFLIVAAAYVMWLFQKSGPAPSFKSLLRRAAPFIALAFFAYPYSEDVYLYLCYGWMGLSGINPYLVSSRDVHTPLFGLCYWNVPSPYGPIAELLYMASALAVPISPIAGVYVFKTFCLLAHLLNAGLVWALLDEKHLRTKLTFAYLINPVLLSFHVADAHVDVFLCSWILLLAGALRSNKYMLSVVAAWGGALTKSLPIIWMPLLALYLFRRRRWKDIAISVIASVALAVVLTLTVLPTPTAWESLLNPTTSRRYARSIFHVIQVLLLHVFSVGPGTQEIIISKALVAGAGTFGLIYLALWLRALYCRSYSPQNLIADLGWISLALLLLATPWMMPWYPAVLLPIAVLAEAPSFAFAAFLFTLTTECVYGEGGALELHDLIHSGLTLLPIGAAFLFWRRLAPGVSAWRERMVAQGGVLGSQLGLPGPGERLKPSTLEARGENA